MNHLSLASLLLALAVLAACSGGDQPASSGPAPASPHLLATDLPDAVPVLQAKEKVLGDEVAVVGRVRSTAKGVITIVDDSLDYCGSGNDGMDDCETPWDYCCLDQNEVAQATLVVQAKSKTGEAVPKKEIGLRPLDLVAVRGVLSKNESGATVLVAKEGWFRRERPEVGSHVRFEE